MADVRRQKCGQPKAVSGKRSADSGFVLAIDGPAGSGKSTTARLCAAELGFHYLDTGAMYRAVTLKALERGVDVRSARALAVLLRSTHVGIQWQGRELQVRLDGRRVDREIREPGVSASVSEVSAIPAVRRKMVAEQRRAARGGNIVCEGRDIGSVVFPDADLKVYLDCDVAERARRRLKELMQARRSQKSEVRNPKPETGISRQAVRQNLVKRDRIDSGRKASPLVRMGDAVMIDTTQLSIEEQVAVVGALVRRVRARRG